MSMLLMSLARGTFRLTRTSQPDLRRAEEFARLFLKKFDELVCRRSDPGDFTAIERCSTHRKPCQSAPRVCTLRDAIVEIVHLIADVMQSSATLCEFQNGR